MNKCIKEENQGRLKTDKELQVLSKNLKKQVKENKSLSLKLCQKKDKLNKLNTESRELAQYRIASELSAGNCNNITLHSDGTTKHGRSYTTFDLKNQEGKLLACGLREVGAADAQSQL